jgi:bifunctional ADP-heptose synthase (sugar kinase/adenylyltransferase)
VDVLMVNDSEARELSRDWNIHRAARWILAHGPKRVVIKQGEHGAMLMAPGRTFYAPAFPLEEVFDPTGAGDSFAGGFMGYIARTGDTEDENLRRAMVYGAAMGSYAVAQFGIRGFDGVSLIEVERRVRAFRDLTHVTLAEPVRPDGPERKRPGITRPPGSIWRRRTTPRPGSEGSSRAPGPRCRSGTSARSVE